MSELLASFPFNPRPRKKLYVGMSVLLSIVGLAAQLVSIRNTTFLVNSGEQLPPQEVDDKQTRALKEESYFVPSIAYRATGQKLFLEDLEIMKQGCVDPVRDLVWEWYSGSGAKQTTKKLLIGLHSGFDAYASLLQHSAKLAKLYSHQFNSTVVVLQGTAFSVYGCNPPGIHTTLNKIRLLFYAIDHCDSYDQVLLLDADAMLVDMKHDLTSLLDEDHLLASAWATNASLPEKEVKNNKTSFDIDVGATLWNLHHPLVRRVATRWFEGAKDAILRLEYNDIEKHLRIALEEVSAPINILENEFNHEHGTMVQHHNAKKWISEREKSMATTAATVCNEHFDLCAQIFTNKTYDTE